MKIAIRRADLAPATPTKGILLALAVFALFTDMDTAIKVLGGQYHVVQVAYLNSLFALVTVLAIGAARGRLLQLRPRHWRLHLTRWSCSYLATLAIFWSYPRLPLAQAYAILFVSPLLVTALSMLALEERVGWRRWAAVLAGFVGVLLIVDPGHDRVGWPALVTPGRCRRSRRQHGVHPQARLARRAGRGHRRRRQRPEPARHHAAPALRVDHAQPAWPGALGGCRPDRGRHLPAACRRVPHDTLGSGRPYQYSQLLYGLAVGWLLYADLPTPRILLGSAIIICGGLYVMHDENRADRAERAAPAVPGQASPSSRSTRWTAGRASIRSR